MARKDLPKDKKPESRSSLTSMNGQAVIRDIALVGMAKTEKGYALVSAVVTPSGVLKDLTVGNAETYPQFIAIQLRRLLLSTLASLG